MKERFINPLPIVFFDSQRSLLTKLLLPDSFGSVEGSSCDWIEFQILVEGAPRLSRIRKSLLLMMNSEEVEGWHKDD